MFSSHIEFGFIALDIGDVVWSTPDTLSFQLVKLETHQPASAL